MRLFEYFKNLVCREKPTPINSEDEFVYKQLRQITSALSQKLVSMQNIEHNISESFVFISKATALANQSLEANTKLSLMLYSMFCMETSFLDRADVI